MAKQYYQGETFDNVAPDFLHDAEFNDCTFINCRWSGARITACSFLGCTFDRCAWSDVVFSLLPDERRLAAALCLPVHCRGGLQGRSALVQPFGRAEQCEFLLQCRFSGMALKQFDFSKCTFGDCVFDDCKLAGADFRSVALSSTAFSRCDLQKADFREATGYRIDPSDNQMKGARFSFLDVIALLNGFGLVIE